MSVAAESSESNPPAGPISRRIASVALKRPRLLLAAWGLILVAGTILALSLTGRVGNGGYEVRDTQSTAVGALGVAHFGDRPQTPAFVTVDVGKGDLTAAVAATSASLRDSGAVLNVAEPLMSLEKGVGLVPFALAGDLSDAQDAYVGLQDRLSREAPAGTSAQVVGQAAVFARYREYSRNDLRRAAAISLPLTGIVLLTAFLSFSAAMLPLAIAGTCLATTFGGLYLYTFVGDLNVFAEDIALVLGLALSIDFSLFMVTRYRELLGREGTTVAEALAGTLATTGRAVAFSAVTVAASLAGLLVVGVGFFTSMAAGAIMAVAVAAVASLTLTPALLVLFAERLRRLSPRAERRAAASSVFWRRVGRFAIRCRWVVTFAVVLVLVGLSLPAGDVQVGFKTFSALPSEDRVRVASDRVSEAFGAGIVAPTTIVARLTEAQIRETLGREPGVASVASVQTGADGWSRTSASLVASPDSNAAEDTVRRLRGAFSAFGPDVVAVGGTSAQAVDFAARLDDRTPLAVLVILLVEIAMLTAVLRAPVVAVKAALTTLVSVTATLGIMVLIFGSTGEIGFFVPLLVFAIVFGLSTDYEVFLMSRMREEHLRGATNAQAIETSLATNGRAITLAGLTMALVFVAFVSADLPSFVQLGIGVSTAILIDVTVVRSLLVPSTMALLGAANWWRPTRFGTGRRVTTSTEEQT